MLFKKLCPIEYHSSAYSIDYDALYEKGYRGIIFDIDNTLVPHDAPADERSVTLCDRLKSAGFRVLFLSNNEEPRVKMFNDEAKCLYVFKAGKPLKRGYEEAMRLMGTDTETTFAVGDQLLTDIWGANNAGILSVLVEPIDLREPFHIRLKRILERIVFKIFHLEEKKT
ncbi:MAG: YqeG family HAD IIIA-type phosphatase [Lachnospiraceae bacterium]|nr:YqeG family HAD IIIA-type phosphatase [Lachnospiraceae bacterium]